MISRNMMMKIISETLKKFSRVRKMAALNQERFTLATDDTIEELRNDAKNVNTSKRTSG